MKPFDLSDNAALVDERLWLLHKAAILILTCHIELWCLSEWVKHTLVGAVQQCDSRLDWAGITITGANSIMPD